MKNQPPIRLCIEPNAYEIKNTATTNFCDTTLICGEKEYTFLWKKREIETPVSVIRLWFGKKELEKIKAEQQ